MFCLGFNIYRQVKVAEQLEELLKDDDQFVDFEFLGYWSTQFNNAVAAMVFLSWIKIFKYLSFNKTMTQLSLTLSTCASDVIGFSILFFIVFLAYAQLGFLIFGTQVKGFCTINEAMYDMFFSY